jgi:hypothetical protein
VTHADLERWLAGYERLWRTPGTGSLGELFAADATYSPGPYDDPLRGLVEIGPFWESEREGPDEPFTMERDIVAVEDDVGVARVFVRYGDPPELEYRDLWIVTLDADGRCTAFEEWPFFPGQLLVSGA